MPAKGCVKDADFAKFILTEKQVNFHLNSNLGGVIQNPLTYPVVMSHRDVRVRTIP